MDKNNPWKLYTDFWDWLQQHPIWILTLLIGYMYYYLSSTDEVKRY